jgi:hypothetical protein
MPAKTKKCPKAQKTKAAPPPKAKPSPLPKGHPDWILNLSDHLDGFGSAIQQSRAECRKRVADALSEYDDAVYDAVLDGTPKDVLEAMKKGQEDILDLSDSILETACNCAEDHIEAPPSVLDIITGHPAREAGDDINAALCEADALWQYEFCQSLVRNLTHDAREALLNALLP